MKRLPYPVLQNTTGKRWWRSLRERDPSPEFQAELAREFPAGAAEPPQGVSRRDFFRLSAASAALAGVAACRRPDERILPYSRSPEEVVPGNPLFFATAMPWANTAIGLLVESHEGRPTKIEGNPRHPESLGSVNNWAQAEILNLYDPDRSESPTENGQPRSWEQAEEALAQLRYKYRATQGKGLAILTEPHRSPTNAALLAQLKAALPQLQVFRYDAFSKENSRAGAALAFGRPLEAVYDVARAHVIVSFDADFLMDDGTGGIRHAKGFAQGRNVLDARKMARLYSVESQFSVTGSMADHRLRMTSRDVGLFALRLAKEAGVSKDAIGDLPKMSAEAEKFFHALALDLDKNRKVCLMVAGDKQPPVVHAAVHLANLLLGGTFKFVAPFDAAPDGPGALLDLARKIGSGDVTGLVILGGNPVWNAPTDAQLGNMIAKLQDSVHLSTHRDETSAMCRWHLNRAHFLESWGDVRSVDGTQSVIQPLIAPLFDGRSDAEVLQALLGDPGKGYDLVRTTLRGTTAPADFEKTWRAALVEGTWPNTQLPLEDAPYPKDPAPGFTAGVAEMVRPAPAGWEVTFGPDPHAYDGRFANNGWTQELPDPMFKLTWGNVALLSPGDADKLDVDDGDLITVTMADGAAETLPALVAPGQADGSLALTIGQGRKIVGRVGEGIGHITTRLRSSTTWGIARGAKVVKAGGTGDLARTQEHFNMEDRALVREATVLNYVQNPNFAKEMGEHYPRDASGRSLNLAGHEIDYSKGHKWAMTIDLNTCIGCGGCTIACVAENNIPVVGKEGVQRSREMHWIRVDRYFEGTPEDPHAVNQPMTCQQCENAPCEEVCPVGATSHSPEGLNDMAYNRCIGTKYCLNNCPFKVRRFNYFNYNKEVVQLRRAQFNPEVTVRSRGVMEKCTYCIQRIQSVKIQGHVAGTNKIEDGKIKTACQQACPTDAITFGDLNDPDSRVAKLKAEPRAYTLLDELNVRARTTYLARIRNPNPELA